MNFLKKNKLAFLSITLMILAAGYINYEYNPTREKKLGQTVYVNGKDNATNDVSIYKATTNDYVYSKEKENTISVFKFDRDNMFSELSENYKQIISNTNTNKENVNSYQDKLNQLINKKTLITMVENIIKSNGIDDIVILPTNNDNLNVIIKTTQELKKEDIAKIMQIIVDQFNIKADKITITQSKK